MLKRILGVLGVTGILLAPGGIADAYIACNKWVTVSTTAKSYSPCNQTTIGPWTSPLGGCLRWVSWRRYQQRINPPDHSHRLNRTLLENEVQAQWKVSVGPIRYTKTQTIPGSHTTRTIATSVSTGSYRCTLSP